VADRSGTREPVNPLASGASDTAFDSRVPDAWACCAAGSAPLWQGGGPGFESRLVHVKSVRLNRLSARLKPGRFPVRSRGRTLMASSAIGEAAWFSARKDGLDSRTRCSCRRGVHGDTPLFQSGVAGSTPADGSWSAERRCSGRGDGPPGQPARAPPMRVRPTVGRCSLEAAVQVRILRPQHAVVAQR
jgi:hypothetical protein